MPSSKWQQHVLCTQLMKRHPEWTNEQVLQEADMRPVEMNIVEEARREVSNETVAPVVDSQRSY